MSLRDPADPPLSIGYYCPRWPPGTSPNGIVTYVSILARQLQLLGHRTSILAGSIVDGSHGPRIYDLQLARSLISRRPVNRVMYGLWWRISQQPANSHLYRRAMIATCSRAVAEQGLHIMEMEETCGWARWLHAALSIPICVRLHGPWFEVGPAMGFSDDARFRRRVDQERRAILGADAVTAPSRCILEKTRAYYGLTLPNAEVIPNATELQSESWRLDRAEPKRILFVGRFDRLKGGDLIIDAFARILQEEPGAQLWFVGPDRGCQLSNGEKWNLEDYVRWRSPGALESRSIEWLGAQPYSALAPLRRQAMVCVVSSRYETFPYTVIEAMALGCPIVAANVGGIPEILRHNSNGLLHRHGDSGDLAAKVISLLKNPKLAAALGQKAAQDCRRNYHPEVIASRTVDFYQSVIRHGKRQKVNRPPLFKG